MLMADDSVGQDVIQRLVDEAWSARSSWASRRKWRFRSASADPGDPEVRAFAEFGLAPVSSLATNDQLDELQAWRDGLQIPANSAFLDGTLLLTVEALLDWDKPNILTPVTLWELTAFIDALVCFDQLYCIASPAIDVSLFNERLGAEVLAVIPDPEEGILRRLAGHAAANGLSDMSQLRARAGHDDAWGQEVQAVVEGWRAVLGPDIPNDGPFDVSGVDIRLATMNVTPGSPQWDRHRAPASSLDYYRWGVLGPDLQLLTALREAGSPSSAILAGGALARDDPDRSFYHPMRVLIEATRLPQTPASTRRPPLSDRQRFAATATYRTYVNQGIANALALPYLPGTLRMPFRRLFVRRAGEIQDELVTAALADRVFAQQQPSSPLILPFFTAAVLQRAATREDIWRQMAEVRHQSAAFRRTRADLDRMLERSEVSAEALRVQNAVRDEALKLADLAGASQQAASVALGVVAQTGIVPLAGALKVGVDAAKGVGRGGSWTRVWRRLFHRHEYFLAQTNTQAMALTNALPQLQQLWQMPKIGGYLTRFANSTQEMGRVLRG
jgi:hypothetical protein